MPAGIEVLNDSDVLVLNSDRNALVLLAKNSRPAGTVLYAYGAAGATYAFGLASGPASYGLQTVHPRSGTDHRPYFRNDGSAGYTDNQ